MSEEKNNEVKIEEPVKVYTKSEIQAFVADLSKNIVDKSPAYLHSVLALNHILRQANLNSILDADLKEQLQDVWKRLKSTGLELQDPPILFPQGSSAASGADGA